MIDFHVCGINFKTSTLTLRERMVLVPEQQLAFLSQFKQETGAKEAGVLMTCNRSEWFWSGSAPECVQAWLARYFNLAAAELEGALYTHSDNQAVRHFIVVASGLDSMMLGEPQIFGQMKAAFLQMQIVSEIGCVAKRVFPFVFSAAKKVRSQTAIGTKPNSVAYAAINLARCIFNDLAPLTLLLIGAGETTELVAKYFAKSGIKQLIAANRTFENAEQLAIQYGGQAIRLDELSTYLGAADIIVSATASQLPLLKESDIATVMRQPRRPLYIIDLAMPRDVEPAVGQIEGVHLYNLDDLQAIVNDAEVSRSAEIQQAYAIINQEMTSFMLQLRTRESVPEICSYRSRMEQERDIEVQKALQQLRVGVSPEEVLIRFATVLTNKFMHEPTLMLRALSLSSEEILS
ncbi:MAG: glutamyl-tRNA reductase [Legionellales bacterium]|nr:glutamyl-tRNA reductase [Legionellales bacterium]